MISENIAKSIAYDMFNYYINDIDYDFYDIVRRNRIDPDELSEEDCELIDVIYREIKNNSKDI